MSVTIQFGHVAFKLALVFDVVCDTSATEYKPRERELLSIWPGDVNEVKLSDPSYNLQARGWGVRCLTARPC
jgi:hypothetical protein